MRWDEMRGSKGGEREGEKKGLKRVSWKNKEKEKNASDKKP